MAYETRGSFRHDFGKTITTDGPESALMAHLAHLQWSAEDAVAADADAIMPLTNLGAEVQSITTGLTNPPCPRSVQIVGNVTGITGNVKIYGTNAAGDAIDETIAAEGTTNKEGNKAFKSITKVDLPVQVHTPAAQVETATAAGTVTVAGNALVTVKSALFADDEAIDVPVEQNDDANAIALAIRTALANNLMVAEHFDVSGEGASVILTAKVPAANDDTLNIAINDGTGDGASEGVTPAATSANTTPGVPYDQISVGWGDKLGLGYNLAHNTVLPGMTFLNNVAEATPPAVATSASALESNTLDLSSALNGSVVDTYLLV